MDERRTEFSENGGDGFEFFLVARDQDKLISVGGQELGQLQPNSNRSARD